MVNYDVIKKLIKIVEESDITGLAVEEEGMKIEVRREKGGVQAVSGETHSSVPHAVIPETQPKAEAHHDDGVTPIVSPMVGTFYRAPSPDSSPYVEIGDFIESGKVVCIIEAMKLFNEIEAEVKGKVVKILVDNAQPVEYGQTLMLIKKE
ncbi:MAG: acetyl-CoA carboxylase biotin carboxyl carrier protein [Candidatus Saganbacteria bacterium]|jgi:acetyl-CoA carboxylase biotin carboxyl carrier protein|nr:acetyl-CoA carboxylase biotin carboxyl carrier protein [Candidatus Saganbacteria bacterium]